MITKTELRVKSPSAKEEMKAFQTEIQTLMKTLDLTAMEAVVHYAQKRGMEVEVLAKMINDDLKSMIKDEAIALNCLRYKNGKVIRGRKSSISSDSK